MLDAAHVVQAVDLIRQALDFTEDVGVGQIAFHHQLHEDRAPEVLGEKGIRQGWRAVVGVEGGLVHARVDPPGKAQAPQGQQPEHDGKGRPGAMDARDQSCETEGQGA